MSAQTFSSITLCRPFEVTARALRFCEDRGLLAPLRRRQTRFYSAKDRARLGLILRGKRLGFSLSEIAELIDPYDPSDGGALQLERSLAAVDAHIEQLQSQSAELEQVLAELTEARAGMQARRAELAAGRSTDRLPKAEDCDRLLRPRVDGDATAYA